jgi:hypothetical protein
MQNTKQEFINYLNDTLIPDLKQNGHEATAEDFEEAIFWLKSKEAEIKDQEKIAIGQKLGKILGLKKHFAYAEDQEKTRYQLKEGWGDKTDLGLYETINRIIQERGR